MPEKLNITGCSKIINNNNNRFRDTTMWNLKYTIISVIIGATGIVMRSLRKNFEAIPGKHLIDSLQRQLYLEYHT